MLILILFCVIVQTIVQAAATINNINLSPTATVTASAGSSNLNGAIDDSIPSNHNCGNCADIQLDEGEAWITLDFGTAVEISTILFFVDSTQNIDGYGDMTRTYGLEADRTDITTNKLILQMECTNYPIMVADINELGPAQVRYIHWRSN